MSSHESSHATVCHHPRQTQAHHAAAGRPVYRAPNAPVPVPDPFSRHEPYDEIIIPKRFFGEEKGAGWKDFFLACWRYKLELEQAETTGAAVTVLPRERLDHLVRQGAKAGAEQAWRATRLASR